MIIEGIDKYYDPSSKQKDGFINNVIKPLYENDIFPKLASYQKVAITPQVTNCKSLQSHELGDANDAVAWAKSEPRIAYMVPYRFDDLESNCKGGDLYNFWVNYGKSTK